MREERVQDHRYDGRLRQVVVTGQVEDRDLLLPHDVLGVALRIGHLGELVRVLQPLTQEAVVLLHLPERAQHEAQRPLDRIHGHRTELLGRILCIAILVLALDVGGDALHVLDELLNVVGGLHAFRELGLGHYLVEEVMLRLGHLLAHLGKEVGHHRDVLVRHLHHRIEELDLGVCRQPVSIFVEAEIIAMRIEDHDGISVLDELENDPACGHRLAAARHRQDRQVTGDHLVCREGNLDVGAAQKSANAQFRRIVMRSAKQLADAGRRRIDHPCGRLHRIGKR
ncbi:hypothetical protein ACVI8K_005658 [Bradyrhizobium barranii subsp. barranii]